MDSSLIHTQLANLRLSLQAKLVLLVIGIFVIVYSITTVIIMNAAQNNLVAVLQDNLVLRADTIVDLIGSQLTRVREIASQLATTVEVLPIDEEQTMALLRGTLDSNPDIFGSTVAYEPYQFQADLYYWSPYFNRTPEGNLTFTQLGNPDYDYFNQAWYAVPKATQQPTLSRPYFDEGGGNIWMVTWSVPFYDESGAFKGIATADIPFDGAQNIVRRIQLGVDGYAFLMDSHGILLGTNQTDARYELMVDSYPRIAEAAGAAGWRDLLMEMQTGGSGFRSAVDPDGNSFFVAYAPVGADTDWSLGLAFAEQELFVPVDTLRNTLMLIAGVAIILTAVTLFISTGTITRPLVRLATWAHAISDRAAILGEGSTPSPPVVHTGDELEELSTAFNTMTAELTRSFVTLEQRVEERTRDLKAAREEAERANRVKSQFLAAMSHELRTPLNGILNFSRFVSSGMVGPVNEEQVDLLEQLHTNATHLLSLINDILDISKIEAGALELFIESDIDIKSEMEPVIKTAEALLTDKPVRLTVDISDDLPPITGDKRRIRQSLLNLVSNACKFTVQGEVGLRVYQEGDFVKFIVTDTGMGIPRADFERIFETFRQSHIGLRQGGGTGLGLPISRRLIEAHGGTLIFASEVGVGSTFTVTLPIRPPIAEANTVSARTTA